MRGSLEFAAEFGLLFFVWVIVTSEAARDRLMSFDPNATDILYILFFGSALIAAVGLRMWDLKNSKTLADGKK